MPHTRQVTFTKPFLVGWRLSLHFAGSLCTAHRFLPFGPRRTGVGTYRVEGSESSSDFIGSPGRFEDLVKESGNRGGVGSRLLGPQLRRNFFVCDPQVRPPPALHDPLEERDPIANVLRG